jgi:hypothetical protein
MKTRTKSCGFAAFGLALVALVGCGGGGSNNSGTTGGGGGGGGTTARTNNLWTYVSGSKTISGSAGSYGTLGIAAATNQPPSRYGAANWTDASGNVYIFGGLLNDGTPGFLSDLWKYNPGANQWTWLSGASTGNQAGVYGTINVAAASNAPGARYGASYWRDTSGNFYLFGGVGIDVNGVLSSPVYMNDLWKYNIATNQWTWLGGSSSGANGTVAPTPGVYGTKGAASASNQPGVRARATSKTDSSGNFWMFGGQGADSAGAFGSLSDLWKYSASTNQWTWVAGPTVGNQGATYGTLGAANAANTPSGRYVATGWADSSGNLWLFGGDQATTTSTGGTNSSTPMNDFWKFSTSGSTANQWTWVGGSSSPGGTATYGTQGSAAAGNIPGARSFAVGWVDSANNLYLFGGAGIASGSPPTAPAFNDLWKYSTSSGQWTWLAGANTGTGTATYGTQGTASADNNPGGRLESSTWIDGSGNLWLFGGLALDSANAAGTLNDLWKNQP